MDGLAHVLNGRETQYPHLSRLRIDLKVDDVAAVGRADAGRVDGGPSHDGVAGPADLSGKLLEAHGKLRIGLRLEDTVDELNRVLFDVPDQGGARDHLALDVLRGVVGRQARGERDAAPARTGGEPDLVRADDHRADVLGGDAQHLGGLHRDGRSGPADVRRPLNEAAGPVRVDVDIHAGWAATIDPPSDRDTAAPVWAFQRRVVVRVGLHRVDNLDESDGREDGTVHTTGTLFGGVQKPKLKRVHPNHFRQLVDHRLGGELGVRRAGGAVGVRGRLVDVDAEALDVPVFELVGSEHAHAARPIIEPAYAPDS